MIIIVMPSSSVDVRKPRQAAIITQCAAEPTIAAHGTTDGNAP